MKNLPITELHQAPAPWEWQLADSHAATLAAHAAPRWLQVNEGCVWVTAEDAGPHAPDLWLQAGAHLQLPAGSTWVLQAWPQARMSLLLAQPALRQDRDAAASPAPKARPARAWWQSSWFFPWVLPTAQGQRRPVMS